MQSAAEFQGAAQGVRLLRAAQGGGRQPRPGHLRALPRRALDRGSAAAPGQRGRVVEVCIAKAHLKLGELYCEGKGMPQDYSEAITWSRKAAEQGDAKAQGSVGTS